MIVILGAQPLAKCCDVIYETNVPTGVEKHKPDLMAQMEGTLPSLYLSALPSHTCLRHV